MRELHVAGLDEDAQQLLLTDPESGERYQVPVDDRLRAFVKGETPPPAPAQATSRLRPREIQTRIRAGAALTEVAEAAGLPVSRVERFAHPVLLERSNIADLARRSRLVGDSDVTDALTLAERVVAGLAARGIDAESARWDAWRPEGEPWVIAARWQAGRSEDSAHWTFRRQGTSGAVTPRDEPAEALLDPDRSRPLRTVAPVTHIAPGVSPVDAVLVTSTVDHDESSAPDAARTPAEPQDAADPAAEHTARRSGPVRGVRRRREAPSRRDERGTQGSLLHEGEDTFADDASAHDHDDEERPRSRPTMPSWEDVLLGVRSHTEH